MKPSKKQLIYFFSIILISCLGVYIKNIFLSYLFIFGLYAIMVCFIIYYFKSEDKLTLGTTNFFKIRLFNLPMIYGAIVFSIGIIGIKYEILNSGIQISFNNFYYLFIIIPFLLSLIRIKFLKNR